MPARVGRAAVLRPTRTSTPSRSGRPDGAAQAPRDARRRDRDAEARRARRLAPRERARRARARRASAGTARIRPPSRRTALRPSRRPSRSTSGPPPEPRGSGAVCSIAPAMRRPRGPRKLPAGGGDEARAWRAGRARRGWRARPPRVPMRGASAVGLPVDRLDVAGVDLDDGEVEVGVDARDAAASRGGRRRTSTVTSSPRRLCALVSTRPGADDHAAAAAPAAAEADDAGPTRSADRADRVLKSR